MGQGRGAVPGPRRPRALTVAARTRPRPRPAIERNRAFPTGHYQHGLDSQSSWLTEFRASQPRHVTLAAWTVQHKYYTL